MQRDPFGEDVLCFLCDYGLFALMALILAVIALTHLLAPPSAPAAVPVSQTTSLPNASPAPAQQTSPPPGPTPLAAESPSPAASPTSGRPPFTLVFIAVNWQGTFDSFRVRAAEQAATFQRESGIDSYFDVQPQFLAAMMNHADLTDPTLADRVQAFAIENGLRADRYIGLTNADLAPEGQSSVVGWTAGGVALVAEVQDPYVSAHELGHTFGLCDEYSYADWSRQNQTYSGGCPNPYPADCPQTLNGAVACEGQPASDGSNSIMGPSGLAGDYSYNAESLAHLQAAFDALTQEKIQP